MFSTKKTLWLIRWMGIASGTTVIVLGLSSQLSAIDWTSGGRVAEKSRVWFRLDAKTILLVNLMFLQIESQFDGSKIFFFGIQLTIIIGNII